MKANVLFCLLFSLIIIAIGCRGPVEQIVVKPPYDKPLLPGQKALRRVTNPSQIPDFTLACLDLQDLKLAIEKSLNYLNKPSSRQFFPVSGITHKQAVDSLKAFTDLLNAGLTGTELDVAIKDKFEVYTSVGCDGQGTVLFTGYYTPIFEGSLRPSQRFKYTISM